MKTLSAAVLCAVLSACAAPPARTAGAAEKPAARIVTLMPSFAEDLCAIGGGAALAGVSAYSDDVPCARGVPVVNNFAAVNAERVIQLRPGAVVAIPAQRGLAAPLERAGIRVLYLKDDSYEDIFSVLNSLGTLCGRQAQAARLVESLRARTAALREHTHYRRAPGVLFVEQSLPLWTVGPRSYIATMIGLAGGRIVTGTLRTAYAQFSDEALLRADPDVVVATSDAHIENVLAREPWRSLRAVRMHHVFVSPDSNSLVRPGPRYIKGLQWLIARFSSL